MSKTKKVQQWIQIQTQSPLLLGDNSSVGNNQETTDFIPGSSLYGAIGGKLFKQCTQPDYQFDHSQCPDKDDCDFWQLLGKGQTCFGNAYSGRIKSYSYPFPLTARTCKYYPNYPDKRNNKDGHGVWDILFSEFAYNLISDPEYPYRETLQPYLKKKQWSQYEKLSTNTCHFDICNHPLKPITGYYIWVGKYPMFAQSPTIKRTTHVGINRQRGVAEDALLFTQETVESGGNFFAPIFMDADTVNRWKPYLNGKFFVGRGRSRGLGEVSIIPMNRLPDYPTVTERLKQFQVKIAEALDPYCEKDENHLLPSLPGYLFSLTLRTPAILHRAGMPQRVPSPQALGLPQGTVFLQAWARMEEVSGWDGAAQLPRRTRLATKAGSVFLYFAPTSIQEEVLELALSNLEMNGIGELRERGYGQLTACAAFHIYEGN